MITEMKVGKYYRMPLKFKNKKIISINPDGYMDLMLDGNWHKCIEEKEDRFHELSNKFKFENFPIDGYFKGFWDWREFYPFLEEKKEIEDGQYLLDM